MRNFVRSLRHSSEDGGRRLSSRSGRAVSRALDDAASSAVSADMMQGSRSHRIPMPR